MSTYTGDCRGGPLDGESLFMCKPSYTIVSKAVAQLIDTGRYRDKPVKHRYAHVAKERRGDNYYGYWRYQGAFR